MFPLGMIFCILGVSISVMMTFWRSEHGRKNKLVELQSRNLCEVPMSNHLAHKDSDVDFSKVVYPFSESAHMQTFLRDYRGKLV